jgi:hypothetical protein
MGLGPPVIELYRQLKIAGTFNGIGEVMELGSQDYWCPQSNQLISLFEAFDRTPDPALLNTTSTRQKPARLLYEALGFKYGCVDVEPLRIPRPRLQFRRGPRRHKGRYGFVTNHGTSEHIINQLNVFKAIHDFARPGGLFIHAVPFTVHLEHGFFNYQPNFFEALARYNSYEVLGISLGLHHATPRHPANAVTKSDTAHHRQHKVELGCPHLRPRPRHIGQLPEKPRDKMRAAGAKGVGDHCQADNLAGMIEGQLGDT